MGFIVCRIGGGVMVFPAHKVWCGACPEAVLYYIKDESVCAPHEGNRRMRERFLWNDEGTV